MAHAAMGHVASVVVALEAVARAATAQGIVAVATAPGLMAAEAACLAACAA